MMLRAFVASLLYENKYVCHTESCEITSVGQIAHLLVSSAINGIPAPVLPRWISALYPTSLPLPSSLSLLLSLPVSQVGRGALVNDQSPDGRRLGPTNDHPGHLLFPVHAANPDMMRDAVQCVLLWSGPLEISRRLELWRPDWEEIK